MPLSAAQHSEIIKQHWPLLWPMSTARRMQVLDELIADHEQENDLRLVAAAMNVEAGLKPAGELDLANLEF